MINKEQKIFVFYIGILNEKNEIISDNIGDYCNQIATKIIPSNIDNAEFIVIPTYSQNTKIECINPKYITKKELILKHEEQMEKLNNNIKNIT